MKIEDLKTATPAQLSGLSIDFLANLYANAQAAVEAARRDQVIVMTALQRRFTVGDRHRTVERHDGDTAVTIWTGSKSTGTISEFTFQKLNKE